MINEFGRMWKAAEMRIILGSELQGGEGVVPLNCVNPLQGNQNRILGDN